MTSSQTNELRWGRAIAENFSSEWDLLKDFLVNGGIRVNPTPLIQVLASTEGAAAKAAFDAILDTINAGTKHQYDTASDEISTAQERIKDLETQANLQQQQIKILQNQVDTRDKLLATAYTTQLNTPPLRQRQARRTVADPTPFSGKGNAIQRQNDYQNWRSTLLSVFLVDQACFETELQKILHACALLTGDAQDRYRNLVSIIQSSPTDTTKWKVKSVAQLFEDMDRVYITANEKLEASTKLATLVMGPNRPFLEFLSDFEKLATKSEKTDPELVVDLRAKVSPKLNTMA